MNQISIKKYKNFVNTNEIIFKSSNQLDYLGFDNSFDPPKKICWSVILVYKNKSHQQRLINKINALNQLKNSSYFIQMIDYFYDHQNKQLNILTNYYPNNFYSIDKKNLNITQISKWVSQILAGLENLHSLGMIHRNLNCSNICIDTENNACIKGFNFISGIKKNIDSSFFTLEKDKETGKLILPENIILTETNSPKKKITNEPIYMAPEFAANQTVSQGYNSTIDIYSLGIIILVLMEGDLNSKIKKMNDIEILNSQIKTYELYYKNNIDPLPREITLRFNSKWKFNTLVSDFILKCLSLPQKRQYNSTDPNNAASFLLSHPFIMGSCVSFDKFILGKSSFIEASPDGKFLKTNRKCGSGSIKDVFLALDIRKSKKFIELSKLFKLEDSYSMIAFEQIFRRMNINQIQEMIKNGELVAWNEIRLNQLQSNPLEYKLYVNYLKNEIKVMKLLKKSPRFLNIISNYGINKLSDDKLEPIIITEFMPKGTLFNKLKAPVEPRQLNLGQNKFYLDYLNYTN